MKNYVLVGDIHSQSTKLLNALDTIQRTIENYHIIFLGDIFDSRTTFSDSVKVFHTIFNLKSCTVLQSNHQNKLIRYLKGNDVTLNHGLDRTVHEFENSTISKTGLLSWLESFPYGVVFKDQTGLEYRCSHAYFSSRLFVPMEYENEYHISLVNRKTEAKCLYGLRKDSDRIQWWRENNENSWIRVAGHYHTIHIDLENTKSLVLDGECGSDGGALVVYDVNKQTMFCF